jgi:hypothetical protein
MSDNLHIALQFLTALSRYRLSEYFGKEATPPELPSLHEDNSPFTRFVLDKRLTVDEFTVLATALAPHIAPYLFDNIVTEFLPQGGDLPALGGVKGANTRYMLPTGETIAFLLAGSDIKRRTDVRQLFSADHFFEREKILSIEELKRGEPMLSGLLVLDPDYVELFMLGHLPAPKFGIHFPAQRLHTEMEWDDLVLSQSTLEQIRELENWILHHDELMYSWGMQRKLKPGYRILFYGPPGTGKTLTATLLGKYTGKEVFRVDLSMIISKFIGETEKNLASLFDKAQNKNWILFFDEADSIFGKRTGVRDAHDKYANQEVSYLLQRIEDYPGLAILASNFKNNIDEAFTRRFNAMIYFPIPSPGERLTLWQHSFPESAILDSTVDLPAIAKKYELSGAHIINIVQYVCLQALSRNTQIIQMNDILLGVRRELVKEGKSA